MTMHNRARLIVGTVPLLVLILLLPQYVYAHGVKIDYRVDMTVEIRATYDSGDPMAGAQVSVYAPDDPSAAWLTGVCDDEGRFTFVPDVSKAGTYSVQVRLAGHGSIVHIPIHESLPTTGRTGGYTPLQIILMAACIVWGSIGTALYFSRRRT